MTNFDQRESSVAFVRGLCVLCILLFGAVGVPLQAQQQVQGPEGPLDALWRLKDSRTGRISSYDRTGGNTDWIVIPPGGTSTLAEIPGAGVIRRFYLASYAADRMRYRKAVLRMYWDGRQAPCVEVPLGDFFGSGLGTLRTFHSMVVDVNPGLRSSDFDGMVNYFPMPFQNGARITLENDGKVSDFRLWYHIDFEQYPNGVQPGDAGRLHAQWRRVPRTPVREGNPKNTTLGNPAAKNLTGANNFVILDAEGQGSYVGLFLTVDNIAGGWYGEGDDMIFVDGAKRATYPGTGHEEVFNSGCCPDAEFSGLYTGFYLIENRNGNFGGKNQMYRFFVNDPVRFHTAIRVTIEHGHANNFENDYTSTAFWYQKEPHKAFPPMPGARERQPGWPPAVAEALAKELKLREEMATMLKDGDVRISAPDRDRFQSLVKDCNRSFRELREQDYTAAVKEMETLTARYRR